MLGLTRTPLDASPTSATCSNCLYRWEGRSPTWSKTKSPTRFPPLHCRAKVKFVRGESMFGKSFVYVIFEDGTDIYWLALASSST